MKYLLLCLTLITLSTGAQDTSIINYFTANISNGKVILNTEIKGGNQCNGIFVYRSTDSINFTEIGSVAGLCGSFDFPLGYEYIDANPVPNATNYYKIKLGNQGYSSVVKVNYIQYDQSNYKLYPNPISETSILYFNNVSFSDYTFEVFDSSGKRVHFSKTGETNQIALDKFASMNGLFFFTLRPDGGANIIKGRFLSQQN